MTMEFDEMKKIWDSQNNESFYGINERALHNRILSKRNRGSRITNFSELLAISANLGAGCFIVVSNFLKQGENIFMYLLSAWMFITAVVALVSRVRRIRGSRRFDRSMLGDLEHAISMSVYQVRFSKLMRWNILPIGVFTILAVVESGKSLWTAAAILVFFFLVTYASGWEHRFYIGRKLELEKLQSKLVNEEQANHPSW